KGQELRKEESAEATIRIPLWTFAAPAIDGCDASVEHAEKRGSALSFDLLVLGNGPNGSAEYRTTTRWTFNPSPGETKTIFVVATLRVGRVVILKHGRPVGNGVQVDTTAAQVSEPAVLLLPADAKVPVIDVVKNYPLADDTSGGIATYRYEYESV